MRFSYKAVADGGTPEKGSIEALNRDDAIAKLRAKYMTLTEVRAQSSANLALSSVLFRPSKPGMRQRDLVFIARQLENLLRAGSELDRSLQILAELTGDNNVKATIRGIGAEIRRGQSLADALTSSGRFPDFFISMIRAGESAGALGDACQRLAAILERQQQARSKLISALIYPAILLLATVASVVLIMTVVVPQFQPIFEQARQELPFLTRLVIGISHLTILVVPVFLPAIVVTVTGISIHLRKPAARQKWDAALLKIPLIGTTLLKSETAKFAYILGALLQGGAPLVNALDIAQGSAGNRHLRAAIGNARELVRNGVKVSAALDRQASFPSLLVQLTSIAEEGAKLGETLLEIGRIYDNETETTLQRLVAIATPLATIGLGGMVAMVLAAILLAVLKINDLAF